MMKQRSVVITFIALMLLYTTLAHAGVVFFCSPQGYWGYTERWLPEDNLVLYSIDHPERMTQYGWYNGGPVGIAALDYAQLNMNLYGTTGGPLPYGSAVIAQFSDGSCIVTPNSTPGTGIVSYGDISTCYAVANGGCGNNPLCYNNGKSIGSTLAYGYQAGQMAPKYPASWVTYSLPPTPAQTIATLQAHLEPVSGIPQAPYTAQQKMQNTSITHLKANGVAGQYTMSSGGNLNVTVSVDTPVCPGYGADYWIATQTPTGDYWYTATGQWTTTMGVTFQGGLQAFPDISIYNGPITTGTYYFYFGIDMRPDGVLNQPLFATTVRVNVR